MFGTNNVVEQMRCMESDDEREPLDSYNFEELTNQCQRYEEQIVELHSVIAELSRKLEVEQDDIIPEETETSGEDFDESYHDSINNEESDENESSKTAGCNSSNVKNKSQLNKRQEDYNSVVFERDLESQLVEVVDIDEKEESGLMIATENCDTEPINGSAIDEKWLKDEKYNPEILDQIKKELEESRKELEQLKELLTIKDGEKDMVIMERNSLKRQLNDLQATMEYQDAKMDLKKKSSSRKSSTMSSKFTNDASNPSIGTVEDHIIHSHLLPLSNSKSFPENLKPCDEHRSSTKQVQRRRSFRKTKKISKTKDEQVSN